jgi:Chalcone isomerase-like
MRNNNLIKTSSASIYFVAAMLESAHTFMYACGSALLAPRISWHKRFSEAVILPPRYVIVAVTALIFLPLNTFASEKPTELTPVIKAQTPYGSGKLSQFFFHIYDVHIWTDAPRWSYDAPFALSVTYGMSITKQDLVDSTLKEIFRQHEPAEPVMQVYGALLNKAYDDVKDGDRITAIYTSSGGIELYLNAKKMAESDDKVFAKHFFDIWLSSKTSEPDLRKSLLKVSS